LAIRHTVQKNSPEFEFGGQRLKIKVARDKKRKSAAFFAGLSCVVRQFYAGGKISACCLV